MSALAADSSVYELDQQSPAQDVMLLCSIILLQLV